MVMAQVNNIQNGHSLIVDFGLFFRHSGLFCTKMERKLEALLSEFEREDELHLENEEEQSEERSPLPKTVDEWLAKIGYASWPVKLEEENNLNLTPEDVGTGTLDDIINALAAHAPLDLSSLDEVLKQVDDLEKKVYFYASKILNVEVIKFSINV